jgi:hypothetical protein
LDTGDGAAVTFLGDPEDALFVAMNLVGLLAKAQASEPPLLVRVGVNLGPVRLMRDINGQPNIIGDGINVAQRVMSFAEPGKVLVSRSYHEVVTRLSQEYEQLFAYQGSRTDKHVREHEIYEVSAPVELVQELAARRHSERARHDEAPAAASVASTGMLRSPGLAWGFVGLGTAALAVAAFFSLGGRDSAPPAKPAVQRSARPTPPAPAPESTPVEAPVPTPTASAPEPAEQQPLPATKPEPVLSAKPEPRQPHARPVRESRAAVRQAEPKTAVTAALPEPPAPAPAPRAEPVKETKPEPEAAKALTLPTQYRAASGPTGLVMLAISPWGEVFVDGKSAGVSPPMAELELAPGKHRIEIRNGAFKPYQTDVDLGPNETTRVKHKFLQGR